VMCHLTNGGSLKYELHNGVMCSNERVSYDTFSALTLGLTISFRYTRHLTVVVITTMFHSYNFSPSVLLCLKHMNHVSSLVSNLILSVLASLLSEHLPCKGPPS